MLKIKLLRMSRSLSQWELSRTVGISQGRYSMIERGLIDPTEGKITMNGVDVTAAKGAELRHIRRHIGMIFRHFNLVKRSTVMTNVLNGRLGYLNPWTSTLGIFPQVEKERAIAALTRVGIADKVHSRADALSGGQQQRVGIARTLMQEPTLILADEPVASLDPVLAHSIMQYLERLNKEDNVTIICSLHYLDLIQRYGTRVIGLKDGVKVFEGLPSEINREKFKEVYGEEAQDLRATALD